MEKFMAELKLTQIWTYPIKSLGGISMATGNVMEKGIQYDRRWMLVDPDGKFMTQRIYPNMALFTLAFDHPSLLVSYRDESITIPLAPPESGNDRQVQIWDDTVSAVEVGTEYSDWFTKNLGIACTLVYFPEQNRRPIDPDFNRNDNQVSLADGYPYLMIGQSSLDALNEKMSSPVPINRFRPNFVFSGGKPHDEDLWSDFLIGTVPFVGVKPCSRCVLTTVNQETGEKGVEPLRTLSTYRKNGSSIHFGQNLVARGNGVVHVGDSITFINS
jgi:hypothetical protein